MDPPLGPDRVPEITTHPSRALPFFAAGAALLLAGILLAIVLGGRNMAAFKRSLATSRRWGTVQAEISELGEALTTLDAPANDVFISGNVQAERGRLDLAAARVRQAILAIRQGPLGDTADHIATPVTAQIDSVEMVVATVDRQAQQVFGALERGRRTDAERAMAAMDHAYIGALAHLRQARGELELVQRVLLQNQDQVTRQVNLLGRWIAGAILVLCFIAVVIGLRVERRGRRAGEERVTALERLATTEAELRQALERLAGAAEERYSQLVQHAPDVIYRLGPAGEIASINPAFERITGFPIASVVGRHFGEFTHPDDLAAAVAHNQRTMDGAPVESMVIRIRRADGSYFDGEITSGPLSERDAGVGVLGMMRDATELRRAAREEAKLAIALRAAAQDWLLTFDAVNIGLVVLDSAGQIRRLNRAARDFTGLPFDDLIGRQIGEVGPGAPWAEAAELARSAAGTDEVRSRQVDHDPRAKSWSLTAVHYRVPDGDRVILTMRDITELMDLRRALEHNETMSTLGVLIAGVAHEVRNPLFAISATLDAFEVRYQDQPEYRDWAAPLRPEVERLSQLMRDLLEYGRPPELNLERCDLGPVLLAARDRTSAMAARRGVSLDVRIAPGLPTTVADPSRVLQIYQNVLDNAVRHAPSESAVEATLELARQDGTPWLRCSVSDQGPGFDTADLPRIFEPFFSRRRGGTGLGLSIVQRLVELHRGAVIASNREQGGAVVTLFLPVTHAGAEER